MNRMRPSTSCRSDRAPTLFALGLAAAALLLPTMLSSCGSDAGGGGTGGTGGISGGGTGGAGGVCDAPNTVFKNTCGVAGCHDPAGSFKPDLASPGVANRLINQPEMISPMCAGMNLVNPAKPADGVLFKRLTGMTCGVQMPYLSAPPTNQAALDCITSWVNSQLP